MSLCLSVSMSVTEKEFYNHIKGISTISEDLRDIRDIKDIKNIRDISGISNISGISTSCICPDSLKRCAAILHRMKRSLIKIFQNRRIFFCWLNKSQWLVSSRVFSYFFWYCITHSSEVNASRCGFNN